MDFDGHRYPRIVVIARPSPSGLADHSGQVIGGRIPASCWFKPQFGDGLLGAADVFRRAIKVDVVLRPKFEFINVVGPERDSFQDAKVYLERAKRGNNLEMDLKEAFVPQRVSGEVTLQACAHHIRQAMAAANSQWQCKLATIREAKQFAWLDRSNSIEAGGVGIPEAKGFEHRLQSRFELIHWVVR